MRFVEPTKLKIWSTVGILMSFWLSEKLGDSIALWLYQALQPGYMEAMGKALEPEITKMVGNQGDSLFNIAITVSLIQLAIAMTVSYFCSCLIVYFSLNRKPEGSNVIE